MADLTIAEGLEYFKGKENAFIATVETGTSATRAYEVGDYFWKGGKLYEATAPIVSGTAFTAGTNCKLAVIGDDVSDLKESVNQIGPAVYAGFEQKTITDVPIASFDDGADDVPVKKLVIDIEPVQSGTGDPSQDNVRSITGWTGAKVTRTGVNVWDEEWEVGTIDATTGTLVANSSRARAKNYIPVVGGTTYYFYSGTASDAFTIVYYDKNKSFIRGNYYTFNRAIAAPDGAYYAKFTFPAVYEATYNNDISINYPATDTAYHAYSGATYDIAFPSEAGTVHGGTLEVNEDGSGTLTVDHKQVSATLENTNRNNATSYFITVLDAVKDGTAHSAMSNVFKSWNTGESTAAAGICFVNSSGAVQFNTVDSYASVSELLAAIPDISLVYPLATPQIYSLTAPQVKTLLGLNNIWADTGDVAELTYRAMNNTSGMITITKALIAPVLDSMVADTALVVNDFRIVGDTLYKVTAPIASGGTLTVGTNVTITTIGEQITALLA